MDLLSLVFDKLNKVRRLSHDVPLTSGPLLPVFCILLDFKKCPIVISIKFGGSTTLLVVHLEVESLPFPVTTFLCIYLRFTLCLSPQDYILGLILSYWTISSLVQSIWSAWCVLPFCPTVFSPQCVKRSWLFKKCTSLNGSNTLHDLDCAVNCPNFNNIYSCTDLPAVCPSYLQSSYT